MSFPNDDDDYDDEAYVNPLDNLLATDLGPMAVPSPEGVLGVPNMMPEPIPAATPENLVCLKGPCRHYYEAHTGIETLNSRGTLTKRPVQITRYCRALTSPVDLTDETVHFCRDWAPLRKAEIAELEDRRQEYYQDHPEHAPKKEGN